MPQPEGPAARSGAIQGSAYSESASNGASMTTPARSLYPKLAFFISLLGLLPRVSQRFVAVQCANPDCPAAAVILQRCCCSVRNPPNRALTAAQSACSPPRQSAQAPRRDA